MADEIQDGTDTPTETPVEGDGAGEATEVEAPAEGDSPFPTGVPLSRLEIVTNPDGSYNSYTLL